MSLPFRDPTLPLAERVSDLLGRLTPAEKAAQMLHEAPAVSRLGIPAYNWWNECLHGVARAGVATVFPQAIGLAASFNPTLMGEVARAISDEARAKHHAYAAEGDYGYYKGLTYWSPNINIFRDPRWGRGHETYGECPFLTAKLGVSFVQGLQGEHERYLKLVATAKHLAVHSGPEGLRHGFDARVSPKDLFETYLPAFWALVNDARVVSVMTAYNRVNGEPASASPTLLQRILRENWGFSGYVVSDCWAIRDIHEQHQVTAGPVESAAAAVKAGCDLNCGCTYEHLPAALEQGLLTEAELDVSVGRLFEARLRLGMFDPPERVPFASIPFDVVDSAEHRQLARRAAQQSLVLLKNDGVLPLRPDLASLAVIGPNASADQVLWGNYSGTASQTVTPLEGIRARLPAGAKLYYAEGCKAQGTELSSCAPHGNLTEAVLVAKRADVSVLVLGLNAQIEGEQGDAGNSEAAGDKLDLGLTGLQQQLLEAVVGVGKPVIVVLVAGSALAVTFAEERASAIVQAWYPGEEGGSALADVLFGDVSPAGRLPVTFPRALSDVPAFEDYAMQGRTYRYLAAEPLFPFGFGLSYTRFEYSQLELSTTEADVSADLQIEVSVTVTNTGLRASDEVVQLYVKDLESSVVVPHHELRGVERLHLAAGAARRIHFPLSAKSLSLIDNAGDRLLEPGAFRIFVGGSQPDPRSIALMGQPPLSAELTLTGTAQRLPY
ncbi:MAG TPA: glycoside hydrolase family 3 C-terminal domain-containing protein [Polyangiaceae bacterium]|nr:glycoside hydrolase family 3 C-terminal domain-containing protein [Polyangiaceae bacterium]